MLAVLLLSIESAWGRAGGGGGYGGGGGGGGFGGGGGGGFGGGGGSFGGGGGSGGGDAPPGVIIIAFVVFIALALASRTARNQHVTRTIRRGRALQERNAINVGLFAISTRDPGFSEAAFLDRVQQAFLKIQTAWCQQDLSGVRAFISDGIHERFSLQVGMQQAEGIRDEMQDVKVLSVKTAAVFQDAFDTIHVRVRASAVDYTVSRDTGRRIRGSSIAEEFVEFWSFHRRPGAKSLSGDGAIEGNCPKCGAALEIVDVARCQACGAQVNSGEFDWVLAEITQDQEWRVPTPDEAVPGLTELKQRDPAFSVQHVEDRVSVAFWRMRAAEFYRDFDYARPVLTPDYTDEFSRALEQMRQEREFWKDPAVGQVEVIDIQNGDTGTPDRIRVKVRWSGRYSAGDPASGQSRALRRQAIYTDVFVLRRSHDVVSTPAETFRSAGCSNCGAPLNVNREGACEFCGTVITDGRHDWVLESVQPYSPELAYLRPVPPVPEPETADDEFGLLRNGDAELSLAVLARVMSVDGQISESERKALEQFGAHRGLSGEGLQLVIDTAGTSEAKIPVPRNSQEAVSYLRQLVHAVLADGRITWQEQKLLREFAKRTRLSNADVRVAISRERRQAYQQARNELRRSRNGGKPQST
jgi:predicted lipid-binding transport protein (Tim44 family)/uncharacterized tellurite resistance protein B-like protein